jgi:hypothetical protein
LIIDHFEEIKQQQQAILSIAATNESRALFQWLFSSGYKNPQAIFQI